MRQGIIRGFHGSWCSGLATLEIEDSKTGQVEGIPCDNGPTVRALDAAFGDVIGPGHTVKQHAGFIGKEILWDYDDMGLVLGYFGPA
jgi:hypothetical protein